MLCRIAVGRRLLIVPPTYSSLRPLSHLTAQSRRRISPNLLCFSVSSRSYSNRHLSAPRFYAKSGSGLLSAVFILSIITGGALLFPAAKNTVVEKRVDDTSSGEFKHSDYTDSFLTMAPNTPPGRPGTLTPEQEDKLRDLWAATMKVFGVYEAAPEANGTITSLSTAASEPAESTSDKKEKKKSRLNVFKRNKHDKEDKSESAPTSGTTTPVDVSQLSLSEKDDKHGQNKDFQAALANSSPEQLREAFWTMVKYDHPDALLLRFLRARKWDVEKALIMLIATMHWRAEEMHVDDDIMRKGEAGMLEDSKSSDPKIKKEGEDFLTQFRMGKSFFHGVDKEGRPVSIVRARLHRQGEQSEESLERFTVYTIENARMMLRPPVDTATVVFDMTGFSMANMDYAPVKFMIKCFEANYPESLGAILVHKAPWIFQGIWSIIRGWLDPVVAGKVHFTKNVDELASFIARSNIPTELGGDEDWTYSYVEPDPAENPKLNDTAGRDALLAKHDELVKKYESVILSWIHAEQSGEGKTAEERRRERDHVAEELRANYWESDPYLRAKSLYDRIGIIGPGGKLDFFPHRKTEEKKEGETAPAVAAAPAAPATSSDDLD